jgi:aminoglycoside 3-N-acetyltransferase
VGPPHRATRASLGEDLRRLGVAPGDLLMVHAGLRSLGPVVGGAQVVVQALTDAVGPAGTLVAYVDFEPFFDADDRADVPVFDKRLAPAARDHGVLHETLRTWPGALRSDHPDAGMVALGPRAQWIVADHRFDYGYGPGTPLDRVVQAGGRVLMLGAPLDTITLFHLAEHLAELPDKRVTRYERLMPDVAGPRWVTFEEFETSEPIHPALPENAFELIARDFLAAGLGRQGPVGAAPAHLLDAPALLAFAVRWLEEYVALARASAAGA